MAIARGKNAIDMTRGPLLGKILLFVLPLMATNLLQTLYNAVDVMIVGLSNEPNAVGAVGSTSSFINLVVNIFIGVSVGTDVIVARYIGAEDSEQTRSAVHTSVVMALLFGVGGGIAGMLLAKPIFISMGYEGALLRLAVLYARIYFAGLPFLALTNFLSAIMRAKGDTKTPLRVMMGAGLLNVGLNAFCVLVLDLSVEGVAIATVASYTASALILFRALASDHGDCRICFSQLRLSKKHFREIFGIGMPSGIQSAFFSLSNMLIQTSILQINNSVTPAGSAYAPVVKANAAGGSIENFAFTALNSVMQAASTFTSQNVGVKNYRRVKRVMGLMVVFALITAAVISSLMILFRTQLYALYDVRDLGDTLSTIAYDTAMARVWCKWTTFLLYAAMNAAAGVLRGLGRAMMSASFSLVGTCAFRVVWVYTAFRLFPTLETIYVSYPISWALTGIAFFIANGIILHRRLREQPA